MEPYLQWRTQGLLQEDGVLVGSDISFEWLLPWWWENYRRHNLFPVAFVDFGMSTSMKNWCRKRGDLLSLSVSDLCISGKEEVDPLLVENWEEKGGKRFWEIRAIWYKKLIACLQSPFKRSIWIDLDCEILSQLDPIYSFCKEPAGLSVAWYEEADTFNGGVIAFERGSPVFEKWVVEAFENQHQFRGDEEVLTALVKEKKISLEELPRKYNWSYKLKLPSEPSIIHWYGPVGKHQIYQKINSL